MATTKPLSKAALRVIPNIETVKRVTFWLSNMVWDIYEIDPIERTRVRLARFSSELEAGVYAKDRRERIRLEYSEREPATISAAGATGAVGPVGATGFFR